jgi:hypothetical protein
MFKVTHFEPKTLRWWNSQRAKIDMIPPYQRHGRLWSLTDKAFLVDSILNEYDVPKIYMADFTFGQSKLNKKGLPYAIIDGKQRLEAIFDFFAGKLVLDENFIFQSDPTMRLGGLGYSDLQKNHPNIADIFDNYPLSVMRVITDNEEKINELFVRLNRSKPLTGAEIRNAMTGPVPGIIRLLTSHDFFKSSIRFSVMRGQDKNAAAKILLFEYINKLTETKRKTLDQFTKDAKNAPKDSIELASRRVLDNLDRMSEIFLPNDPLLASAGILPVYYWFVRQRKTNEIPLIRQFLVNFERKRKENRTLVSSNNIKISPDRELVEYDSFNRSTNDVSSYDGRFLILENRFAKFKQN